ERFTVDPPLDEESSFAMQHPRPDTGPCQTLASIRGSGPPRPEPDVPRQIERAVVARGPVLPALVYDARLRVGCAGDHHAPPSGGLVLGSRVAESRRDPAWAGIVGRRRELACVGEPRRPLRRREGHPPTPAGEEDQPLSVDAESVEPACHGVERLTRRAG